MRQTCGVMNGLFDHSSVWRRHYLYSVRHVDETTAFYGPVAPLDWKTMSRLLSFVKYGLEILAHPVQGGPITSDLLETTLFPSEEHRKFLRQLIEIHQISLFCWSHGYLTPEIVVITALELLVNADKTTTTLESISPHQKSINMMLTNMIQSKDQGLLDISAWSAADFAPTMLWRSPAALYILNGIHYTTGIEINSFLRTKLAPSAVRVASRWGQELGLADDFVQSTMSFSSTTIHRRRPDLMENVAIDKAALEITSIENSAVPNNSCQIAGIPSRTSISGVYHLFVSYLASEIRMEQDRGILELIQDPETRRLSGRGFDSLRGGFQVVDTRSAAELAEGTEALLQRQRDLLCMPGPFLHLFIVYDKDGTKVSLLGENHGWAFSGRIGLTMDGAGNEQRLSNWFGDFALLYDRELSQLTGSEREKALQRYREICVRSTTPNPSTQRVVFLPYTFERAENMDFEPWRYKAAATQAQSLDNLLGNCKLLMKTMTTLRENPSFVLLRSIRESLRPLVESLDGAPTLEFPAVARSPAWETEEVFAERQALWSLACNFYYFFLVSTAANVSERHLRSSITKLEARTNVSEIVLNAWLRTLQCHPIYPLLTQELLLRLLHEALDMQASNELAPRSSYEAFDFSDIATKKRPSFMRWLNSPLGLASALIGLGLVTGAAAFGLGVFLTRRRPSKQITL